MAIKRFSGYDEAQAYTDTQQLPRGGYVCRILNAAVQDNQYGQSIKVAFDIDEGDFKGHFRKMYDAKTNPDKKWPGVFLLNVPADDGSERDNWTKTNLKLSSPLWRRAMPDTILTGMNPSSKASSLA